MRLVRTCNELANFPSFLRLQLLVLPEHVMHPTSCRGEIPRRRGEVCVVQEALDVVFGYAAFEESRPGLPTQVVEVEPSAPPDQLEAFKHVPIIVLQGDQDRLVTTTRKWVATMKELGMELVYVEVKGGDHSRFINASSETLSKLFAFFNIVRKDQRPETN